MKYCKNIFLAFLLFPTVNFADEVVFPLLPTRMALVQLEMKRRGIDYERLEVPLRKKLQEEFVALEDVIPKIVKEDQKISQEDAERAEFKRDLDAFYGLIVEKTADEKKIDDTYRYLRSKWKKNTYYIRSIDQAYTTYLLIEVTKGQ